MTCKKFTGYSPGIATVGDVIVGIENRDGNANVRFHQEDTLKRIFERLENARIHINRARMDCGSCSEAIVEMAEKHSRHFYIRANMKSFGLKRTSRIKTFVFKYVSVPAKWIKTAT